MEVLVKPDCAGTGADFWRGRRVLLTGHTGFKGSWLALWLQHKGAQVTGIALRPDASTNLYDLAQVASGMRSHFSDIRDAETLAQLVSSSQPEIVFHLAAQPLVRPSYRDPLATFDTNVMGTANLLNALRGSKDLRAAVMITTDKVYLQNERQRPYIEDDALGGHDPYSASKAASEIVVASYRDSFLAAHGVAVATARAGNVIGGGDWSEDRLIPDAVRAWEEDKELEIRRPEAIRPWQHVIEPLSGYLVLAQRLCGQPGLAGAFNFGPRPEEVATVRQVVDLARHAYGGGRVSFGDGSEGPHEAGWLSLEISKARSVLGVEPRWSLETAVSRTMNWYRARRDGADARDLCLAEIAAYEAAA